MSATPCPKCGLRTIRVERIGTLNSKESVNLSILIESAIKEAGSITRRDLLSLIEEPEKIKGIFGLIEQVELRLTQQDKIVIINGEELQWIEEPPLLVVVPISSTS